jgi:hypothetical protein
VLRARVDVLVDDDHHLRIAEAMRFPGELVVAADELE